MEMNLSFTFSAKIIHSQENQSVPAHRNERLDSDEEEQKVDLNSTVEVTRKTQCETSQSAVFSDMKVQECFLKTKSNTFKKHTIVIGNGIIKFLRMSSRKPSQESPQLMNDLGQCHTRLSKQQRVEVGKGETISFHPLQIDFPPDRTRLLYFEREQDQQRCLQTIIAEQGFDSQLDQYDLLEKLGEGAYSTVMLGKHRCTGELFAIKTIQTEQIANNAQKRAHIDREIQLQARCKNCPNVVRFKEKFIFEDLSCIVMELMRDGDLQQFLELNNFDPLTEKMTRSVTKQIGQALLYLHGHQIIHRDIKLENVMLQRTSIESNCFYAKLADFGLAEKVGEISPSKAGTAGYLAPEIVEGLPYGTPSDIWSLGCLIYAMLTVCLPFQEVSERRGNKGKSTKMDFSRLDLSTVEASLECKDLLTKMLVRDPQRRLTIKQVLEHPFFSLDD